MAVTAAPSTPSAARMATLRTCHRVVTCPRRAIAERRRRGRSGRRSWPARPWSCLHRFSRAPFSTGRRGYADPAATSTARSGSTLTSWCHPLADLTWPPSRARTEGRDDVLLLDLGLAVVEQRGLREVVLERLGAHAALVALQALEVAGEAALLDRFSLGQPPSGEFGSYDVLPTWMFIWCMPSAGRCGTGSAGRLIGIWWKFGPPRRESCVSRYEKMRPCNSGSLLKSIPGTTCETQNATCSVSAKKLSGFGRAPSCRCAAPGRAPRARAWSRPGCRRGNCRPSRRRTAARPARTAG